MLPINLFVKPETQHLYLEFFVSLRWETVMTYPLLFIGFNLR